MELPLPKQEDPSWLQACSQLARDRDRHGEDSNLSPEADSKLLSQGLFEQGGHPPSLLFWRILKTKKGWAASLRVGCQCPGMGRCREPSRASLENIRLSLIGSKFKEVCCEVLCVLINWTG